MVKPVWALEKGWGFTYETSKLVVYEKIELIHPDRREELLADLETRTGLKVKRVEVGKIDFLHDIANLRIYFGDPNQGAWLHHADPVTVVVARESEI